MYGHADSVQQKEEQRQILVHRPEKDVQTPCGHEEEEGRQQTEDKAKTEPPGVVGEHLIGPLDIRDPDVPDQICKHGSEYEREVQTTGDPGHLLRWQLEVHS